MALEIELGYQDPSLVQLSVFLQNRVGQLADVLKTLAAADATVYGLSIIDSVDFAVVRLVVDHAEQRLEQLRSKAFSVSESRVVAVVVPGPNSLLQICRSLIRAEINIHYMYPLLTQPDGRTAIVVSMDGWQSAVDALRGSGFLLLTGSDLDG